MTELIARTALKKARYFLAQAASAQNDDAVLNDRLPFAANLEAAIIYARSSLDHLRNQLKPVHNQAGYKRWHQDRFDQIKNTDSVFEYFTDRRDFIVHQEPEKTNAQISIEAHLSGSSAVSVQMAVIRADGTVEKPESVAPSKTADDTESRAVADTKNRPSIAAQTFFFEDSNWRGKPAVVYVQEFIDVCESFISEAESKFP
jgi:hypothetical protein